MRRKPIVGGQVTRMRPADLNPSVIDPLGLQKLGMDGVAGSYHKAGVIGRSDVSVIGS